MILSPLAKYACSDKEYKLLSRWVNAHSNFNDIEIKFDEEHLKQI